MKPLKVKLTDTLPIETTIAINTRIAARKAMATKKDDDDMDILITCSHCGKHRMISNESIEYTEKAIKDGWNSFGSALYCPECAQTWAERNEKNRALAGEKNTFFVIMNRFFFSKEKG